MSLRTPVLFRTRQRGNGGRRTGAAVRALASLALFACDAGFSSPLASFETRCAELPPSRFEIVQEPVAVREDPTQSIDQLTARSGRSTATHLTFGLTVAHFGHRSEVEIRTIEDRANARACGAITVRVRLSMQPLTLYTAEELDISRCAYLATYQHEQKHVAVFTQVLDEAARSLAADAGTRFGTGVQRATSQPELERRVNEEVNRYLSQFMAQWQRTLNERQDAVDSLQEYARVNNACSQ
jgi:hypothetical protein